MRAVKVRFESGALRCFLLFQLPQEESKHEPREPVPLAYDRWSMPPFVEPSRNTDQQFRVTKNK